ncbi:hypothetical protein JMJ58_22460 (plasmid) [Haloterrigena salifodinae]|uniref:Uncharacterized protein n=1 Tax=Haloterrigena salifodinae TaxID=2675099 RepID=A0A8T8E8C5_9EURY|nr:hypothetical protein [Haloterrigena salifodinae]QRV17742.1 hypothetical protein JMJ58_22460 [Haloterrigena salifodinae]
MERPANQRGRIDRRTLLKTAMVVASSSLTTGIGSVSASESQRVHAGDSTEIGDGAVTAYATTASDGTLSSLGVHFDDAAINALGEKEVAVPLAFPSETASGDALDLHQFTFAKVNYLPDGHWPEGVYDVPHVDTQFFMRDQSTVTGIKERPAAYSIPAARMPTDHIRPPAIDTTDDGEPDTPLVEAGRGEPIADPNAAEHQEDGEFTHTHIYGAAEPDGDGIGEIILFEPMVALDYVKQLNTDVDARLKTPNEYFTADEYPTSYVVQPDDDDGVSIQLTDFESFTGTAFVGPVPSRRR